MPRLPDRFDLLVRRARAATDPVRQLDYVLGALVVLPAWHFLSVGTADQPQPATTEIDGHRVLLVFSDADRVKETAGPDAAVLSIPMPAVLSWCVDETRCDAVLVNPGDDAVLIPIDQVAAFAREWREHRASGFWIPNLTTEEEDFWQEHGV